MGRTNQTKLCYGVIVSVGDTILHKGDYISLRDIATELNLTYHQVADISAGRKKYNTNFKYQPKVEIKKISDLYNNA
mgnify:CR=1 FL=1|tara:strand:- start:1232 stop:1462 length:231 start_codon:yes stop_codon:yes gene_type:complete